MRWIRKTGKLTAAALAAAIWLGAYGSPISGAQEPGPYKNADVDLSVELSRSYAQYRGEHKDAGMAKSEITVFAAENFQSDYRPEVLEEFEGRKNCLRTEENGYVEWKFEVPETGFYAMDIAYFPIEGKGSSIVRSVYIDGRLPYEEARNINLSRVWKDKPGGGFEVDARQNDRKPAQVQEPRWTEAPVRDSVGYIQEDLLFYLTQGTHTVRLAASREPAVLHSVRFGNGARTPAYEAASREYADNGYASPDAGIVYFEAERAAAKSHASIIPLNDRSSPSVSPSHPSKIRLNHIGSGKWSQNGQWIEWDIEVPKSGLYRLGFRFKQEGSSGANAYRRVTIDGKTPFSELENVAFPYTSRWRMQTLGNDKGAYAFYFEGGRSYRLRMEVILGSAAAAIQSVDQALEALNGVYREILIVTGTSPDVNRDYRFEETMPRVLDRIKSECGRLEQAKSSLAENTEMSGESVQALERMIRQLKGMLKKPASIARRFKQFQNDITALATWVIAAKSQPLSLDYIAAAPYESAIPDAGASLFSSVAYHVTGFFASFFEDYNSISEDNREAVTVWVGNGSTGGRDQAQVLKAMADNQFTPDKKIPVNLQLVSMGALLPATLSGKGPDAALTMGQGDPVNYAVRNAVCDLSEFPDYAEVARRFSPGALIPLSFGGGVYGLPETQTFPMLFYRKDILSDLKLSLPDTWEDVIIMLPYLQKKQLGFGLPTVAGMVSGVTMPMYSMLLLQRGGTLYQEEGKRSDIHSLASIEALTLYTRFYTDYEIPQTIDFINRFRSGAVPIGIADYSLYNQLSVFAPELDGIWGFAPVPGTERGDGTIDRTVSSTVTASIILSQTDKKEAAWEFLKWWTGADVQTDFGLELESILGSAARYPTANLEALRRLPWTTAGYGQLTRQWEYATGLPEVPGGYYTPRYIDFAFRDVVNNRLEPGDLLVKYAKVIDAEIEMKRREFGLE